MLTPPASPDKSKMDQMTCQEKIAWVRSKRDVSLAKVEPKLEGIPDELPLSSHGLPKAVLTAREIEITEGYSVAELLEVLRQRKVTVEEVTRAFLRRAALAHAAVRTIPAPINYLPFNRSLRQTVSQSYSGMRQSLGPSNSMLYLNPKEPFSACPSPPRNTRAWLAPM